MSFALSGLWPPVSTAFRADGALDAERTVAHSKRLLADGAHGLAILGTTSEANSMSLDERRRVIDAHVEAGVEPKRLLPGTGACALDDAVALTRRAGEVGAAGVLLLPPFYYKKVSDEGIFRFVAALIEKVGAKMPRLMLYHIPPIAVVGWSVPLVQRLRAAARPEGNAASDWLPRFHHDIQSVLRAELDVRFHPIEGLLAALRTDPGIP